MEPLSLAQAFWNMLFALAIVLCILLVGFWVMKKFFQVPRQEEGQIISIVSSRYLGPKNSLLLIDVLGKPMLLGISPQQISYLTTIDDEKSIQKLKEIMSKPKSLPGDQGFFSCVRRLVIDKPPGKDN